jgi:hypothetical protein
VGGQRSVRPNQIVSELSDRLCECGCGRFTFLSPKTRADRGWVKGVPRRFLGGHNSVPGGALPRGREFVVNEFSGCWIWQRGLTDKGYGWVKLPDGSRRKAHRVYFEREFGPVPEGHVVHHRCANRRCVNPAHLEAVLAAEHNAHHARLRYASG